MSLFQVTKKQVIENYELRTMTGDIVSFTPSYSQLLPDPFSDLNVTVNVIATGGNGTPDNPNPIVGYSSANITRCGVNLLQLTDSTNTASGLTCIVKSDNTVEVQNTATAVQNFMIYEGPLKAGSYILSGCIGGSGSTYRIRIRDKNNTSNEANSTDGDSSVFTILNDTTVQVQIFIYTGVTMNKTFNVMLRTSTSASTFSPYNGQTYTIAFGQTVYGGVLDVTRGKLHVTMEGVDLGSLSWGVDKYNDCEQYRKIGSLDNVVRPISNNSTIGIICSDYVESTRNQMYLGQNNAICVDTSGVLWVSDQRFNMDTNAFKSAISGVIAVYPLATPFDIDLTPVQIRALVGENNVFADCGETTVTCLI